MLQESDYKHAAEILGVETAVIKAIVKVETGNRGGFITDNKPTILFEGHIFWKQLKLQGIDPVKYQKGNEDILYSKWTKKYYKGGLKEYDRLNRAISINRDAANSSASWGLAQIMGFNYKMCGCKSIDDFVEQMSESEGKQLELFINFIKNNHWDVYLKNLDWKGFARHYNGPGYAQNHYDQRLEKAYNDNK